MLDERLTVLTLIRRCIEFCDSHMGEISSSILMGLVAIWAAQVKSTPTVSVILQYSQNKCQPNIQSSCGSVPIKGIKNELSRSDK